MKIPLQEGRLNFRKKTRFLDFEKILILEGLT